jgi:hypothetical protein
MCDESEAVEDWRQKDAGAPRRSSEVQAVRSAYQPSDLCGMCHRSVSAASFAACAACFSFRAMFRVCHDLLSVLGLGFSFFCDSRLCGVVLGAMYPLSGAYHVRVQRRTVHARRVRQLGPRSYAASFTAPNRTGADQGGRGRDAFIAQTLVRPFPMIVIDKRSRGSPEVPFAKWHNSRQTLGLDGPDKSFGERVQIRTPGRQPQGRHTAVPKPVPEGDGVERVPVQNDALHAAEEAVFGVGQVSCDLGHPVRVRLTRDPSDLHGARLEPHHEEDDVTDQSRYGQHLDGEEVGRLSLAKTGATRLLTIIPNT